MDPARELSMLVLIMTRECRVSDSERCDRNYHGSRSWVDVRWNPVLVIKRDNGDYTRVLVYSDYATITGWGHLRKLMGRRSYSPIAH